MIISHLDKVDCIPFRIGHETMVCIDTLYYQISNKMTELYLLTKHKGFVMVVGFTTTYAISSYQHYVIKFVSALRQVGSFFPGTLVTSTKKTERHDITEKYC